MRGTVSAEGSEALLGVEVLSGRSTFASSRGCGRHRVHGAPYPPERDCRGTRSAVIGSAESILADGSLVMEDVCLASVLWHGGERPVRILVSEATPLLGMALMRGSELRSNAWVAER